MHRRDFLRLSAAAVPNLLLAAETPAWSPVVNNLRLGLTVESRSRGSLFIFLENRGPEPLDLFVAIGQVRRMEFVVTAPDGKEYPIADAFLYQPCAGLCNLPIIERFDFGASRKYTFDLDKLFYIPPKDPYTTTLRVLLHRGCSVRAAFQMGSGAFEPWPMQMEHPWLGRVTTPEIRL